MKNTGKTIIACVALTAAWMVLKTYRICRNERINTRIAIKTTSGDNEFHAALTPGLYQIQFFAEPDTSAGTIKYPTRQLPAIITTIVSETETGRTIKSTTDEELTFIIPEGAPVTRIKINIQIAPQQSAPAIYARLAATF